MARYMIKFSTPDRKSGNPRVVVADNAEQAVARLRKQVPNCSVREVFRSVSVLTTARINNLSIME